MFAKLPKRLIYLGLIPFLGIVAIVASTPARAVNPAAIAATTAVRSPATVDGHIIWWILTTNGPSKLNAHMRLVSVVNGTVKVWAQTTADQNGYYKFGPMVLPDGSYTVLAWFGNYDPNSFFNPVFTYSARSAHASTGPIHPRPGQTVHVNVFFQ